MEKLEIIKAKLQAYKVLSNSECRAIGEHLLPEIVAVIEERNKWMQDFREYEQEKLLAAFSKLADEGKSMEYNAGVKNKTTFVVTVKRLPK